MFKTAPVIIANHYQNENCHPDGRIKVGIAQMAQSRWERLGNAKRLFAGARAAGLSIVHVRLAVPPDYRGVPVNSDHIRDWIAQGAWREGTWGCEFMEGLEPAEGEHVVTHICNSAFQGTPLDSILMALKARALVCCGVSTAYTVESTVRHASDKGYDLTVAADACSTATDEQHRNALTAMAPLACIQSVAEIVAGFEGLMPRP